MLDISKLGFTLMFVNGLMGTGKTLFASNYAVEYRNKYPDNYIYANYKLKLSKFTYTPFMFLNYSELDNALIIIDDIMSIKNFDNFIFIITNWSRKHNLHIILTGQYYTMFKKQTRTLAQFEVQTKYIKDSDTLLIAFIDGGEKVYYQQIKNAVKRVKDIYDTKEKVPIPNNNKLIQLVKENSKNIDDLETNLSLYFTSRKTQQLTIKIGRELGFID